MVHPVVVIFTSIKQVDVVPAILPANKVVFATHHKTSFIPTAIIQINHSNME